MRSWPLLDPGSPGSPPPAASFTRRSVNTAASCAASAARATSTDQIGWPPRRPVGSTPASAALTDARSRFNSRHRRHSACPGSDRAGPSADPIGVKRLGRPARGVDRMYPHGGRNMEIFPCAAQWTSRGGTPKRFRARQPGVRVNHIYGIVPVWRETLEKHLVAFTADRARASAAGGAKVVSHHTANPFPNGRL